MNADIIQQNQNYKQINAFTNQTPSEYKLQKTISYGNTSKEKLLKKLN